MVFERTTGVYEKLNKKERVIIMRIEVDFKKSFTWRSNLSNDEIIS